MINHRSDGENAAKPLVQSFLNHDKPPAAGFPPRSRSDGTHAIAESEALGKLYWYDDAGTRHAAADGEGYYIRSDRQPQPA